MSVLKLEYKRILKTRSTVIIFAAALLISALLAYLPTTFAYSAYINEAGEMVELRGLKSIRYEQTLQQGISARVDGEDFRYAVETYQACLNEYGLENSYELPGEVYTQRITPVAPLLSGLKEVFADPTTGIQPTVMQIDPSLAENFYELSKSALFSQAQRSLPEAALKQAVRLYDKVAVPFVFSPASNPNAMDYQVLCAFIVMLLCSVVVSPIYSSNYQTGADDILRCTKHGRVRLALCSAFVALSLSAAVFIACTGVYILLSNSFFGWECVKTSIQLMYSALNLAALDMGGLQLTVFLGCLLSVLATVSFSLFISSKVKNNVTSLCASIFTCLAPVLIYLAVPGSFGLLLRCLVPSAGSCLQSSILYALTDFEFLTFGNLSLWSPFAMMIFGAISVPLFSGLAVWGYAGHGSK
ncbi:MAG: hypothetical protein GX061_02720 [Eubacteriaceae bacterium]|nr:hypothetical protein [Eubacteriaceae bacterium]